MLPCAYEANGICLPYWVRNYVDFNLFCDQMVKWCVYFCVDELYGDLVKL